MVFSKGICNLSTKGAQRALNEYRAKTKESKPIVDLATPDFDNQKFRAK